MSETTPTPEEAVAEAHDATPAAVPPPLKGVRRRMVLFSILGALILAWMFTQVDQRRVSAEVSPLTKKHEQELAHETLDVASNITVSRPYILAGAPVAKIEVFLRNKESGSIQGVAYYYQQDANGWTLTESGGCNAEECQITGAKAFAALE